MDEERNEKMPKLVSSNLVKGKIINISPPQTLALSFLIIIAIGACLLKLPGASTTYISWVDALFTATSATTVTGLVVVDTGADFTVFGQTVIMCLIQIGGLGLMTFAVLVIMMIGKKIGLQQRILVQEAFNQTSLGGLVRLVKHLFIFTIVIEFVAFLILSIRWVPEYGLQKACFIVCLTRFQPLTMRGSPVAGQLVSICGRPDCQHCHHRPFHYRGIGFTVLLDLWTKRNFRTLSLHSKLMIVGTLIINTTAALLIFILEYSNPGTLGGLPLADKMWGAYFQGVTPRTAGFNTLDIAQMTTPSLLLTIVLMFIGAGSASTGSGIKLTTFIVMILATITFLRGKSETVVFKGRLK